MAELDISEELADLAFLALDHSVASVRDGGPLIPFSLFIDGEEKSIHRYVADSLEESVAQARAAIAESPPSVSAYALAYDGYLTVEGDRTDALFVEVAQRGASRSYVFAQRYRPKGFLRGLKTIGNAAFIGREANGFEGAA